MSTPSARKVTSGDLLISDVELTDGIFARSVVVLLDADDYGALGVVVNKLSETPLGRVLPSWVPVTSPPQVLFAGGPVSPEGAICLAALADEDDEPPGWRRVFSNIGLLHLDTPIEIVTGAYRDVRIFAGYAGWDPHQLDAELARGSWHVARARYADVFGDDPDHQWRRALRRLPGPEAYLSTWTPDPENN